MDALRAAVSRVAEESAFAGVVRIDAGGETLVAEAHGVAHRGHGIPNRVETQFAIGSGSKGFTALAVARLVEEGHLEWTTTARSLLGSDLPLIDNGVTIEHLMSHTSGIGDYLDEGQLDDIAGYVLRRPVHELATTEAFLPLLDGRPQVTPPGAAFAYNNGGFIVLALLAERASGEAFHDLVGRHVLEAAGMRDTAFLRSDRLPGTAATGYIHRDSLQTNVLHLPVRGNGDGGCYATVADIHAFWHALFAGAIVRLDTLAAMVRPRHHVRSERKRYGLGFWIHEKSGAVTLEGYDAGVSFRSTHDPDRDRTWTVVSNWSEGAWPLIRLLDSEDSKQTSAATAE